MLWRNLLAVPVVLAVIGSAVQVVAQPAELFKPYISQISRNLPMGLVMRLPSRIQLSGPADPEFIRQLIVKVLPSTTPANLTVGLFTCESGPHPCLVGSFAVDQQNSVNAQRELQRHQDAVTPFTLTQNIRGYLLEGTKQKPSYPFSSVMWEQDGMIYTVSFLSGERENILRMAHSMALNSPIRRTVVPLGTLSR